MRRLWLAALAPALAAQPPLDLISADSLRGHVTFLASDLLAGRDTPSPGLEIAAEYIASQFQRAGLPPRFQPASMLVEEQDAAGGELVVEAGERRFVLGPEQIRVVTPGVPALHKMPVVRRAEGLTEEQVKGRVVVYSGRLSMRDAAELARLGPGLLLQVSPGPAAGPEVARRIRDEEAPRRPRPASLRAASAELHAWIQQPGPLEATVSLRLPPVIEKRTTLRNVLAVWPGSDAQWKDTCVLVTAHYDHVGARAGGEGDRIFNGANDDASGVAALLEVAAAFARSGVETRRTIVFLAVFGEERGLLGSRYYARNPLFPLDRTVVNLNLEHLGRTDSPDGPVEDAVNFTGQDYTDVVKLLEPVAAATGVALKPHRLSEAYFPRSDNYAFALARVPAHTISVAYTFPDYHQPGDHADKLDYQNMARITRFIAAAVRTLADSTARPQWTKPPPREADPVEPRP